MDSMSSDNPSGQAWTASRYFYRGGFCSNCSVTERRQEGMKGSQKDDVTKGKQADVL